MLGSESSATSRTASVSGTARPPSTGSDQSWPSRSKTIVRPSGVRSNPSAVPSVVVMVTLSAPSRIGGFALCASSEGGALEPTAMARSTTRARIVRSGRAIVGIG